MKRIAWIWVVAALLLAAGVEAKEGARVMTLVDLLEVPILSSPRLSPDGRKVTYVLAKPDWKANKHISHIWLVNTDGTSPIQLTNGSKGEGGPAWSPDSTQVAFVAERGDVEEGQILLISATGGEARRLSSHETSVSSITWSRDGVFVYFLAADPKTEEEKEREEAKDDILAFEEDFKHKHLWRISVESAEEERITEGDFSVIGYSLSRDGTRIAHHRARTPLAGDREEGEVWLMDADGTSAVRVTDNERSEKGARLSPDNAQVLFVSWCNEAFEPYYNDNLFVAPAGGGTPRMLLADMPYEVEQARMVSNPGML